MEGVPRTIFHVDMDAFFVSVEELYDPSLIGKAVVVGGRKTDRGVVAAASYEARRFGVHSAMPLRRAAELCPHAIFLEGRRDRYAESSRKVAAVLRSFTPQVEMASIDEAYLDVSGTERLHGPPFAAAHKLHEAVGRETKLKCSIGIASSRLVAKVASDQAKRNGILWILPGTEAAYLAPLDVRKLPGVGAVTEENLRKVGIRKVGDMAALDEKFLTDRFGRWGLALAGKARGEDAGGWFDGEIGVSEDPKSISHEHTFNTDTADVAVLESTLTKLSEMVARRLREHGLYSRTIQIKLRYDDFSTITRAHSIDPPTQIDQDVIRESRALFRANWRRGRKVRLLGVQAGNLTAAEGQLGLLDGEQSEKLKKAWSAVDRLRDKFGESAIALAGGMQGDFRRRVHDALESDAAERGPETTAE
jgi:DNA polymerase-4